MVFLCPHPDPFYGLGINDRIECMPGQGPPVPYYLNCHPVVHLSIVSVKQGLPLEKGTVY